MKQLSARLGDGDWRRRLAQWRVQGGRLDDGGGAAQVEIFGILDKYPNLAAYVARGDVRPAYKRAFDAQLPVYTGKPPTG